MADGRAGGTGVRPAEPRRPRRPPDEPDARAPLSALTPAGRSARRPRAGGGADRATEAGRAPAHAPEPPRCALTIDLEDWFHGLDLPPERRRGHAPRVVAATTRLLAMLAEHDARATFFVLGRVAEGHPDLIGRILAAGHEVGSHGHEHEFVYRQSPDAFARDLDRSLGALDRAGAPAVRSYRAPYFSITRRSLWALDALAAAGISLDSSIMPAPNPRYGIPDAPLGPHRIATPGGRTIVEAPVSCLRLGPLRVPFAGGFYLRFFPRAVVRALMRRTLAEGRPVVLYLHPWELDPAQPRLDLPRRVAATRYHRLGCTDGKLAELLRAFRWTTLSEAVRPFERAVAHRSGETRSHALAAPRAT